MPARPPQGPKPALLPRVGAALLLLFVFLLGVKRAVDLIRQRALARGCDRLVEAIGHSHYDAGMTTALSLGTRYYKRIGGPVLDALSSVVMPPESGLLRGWRRDP